MRALFAALALLVPAALFAHGGVSMEDDRYSSGKRRRKILKEAHECFHAAC